MHQAQHCQLGEGLDCPVLTLRNFEYHMQVWLSKYKDIKLLDNDQSRGSTKPTSIQEVFGKCSQIFFLILGWLCVEPEVAIDGPC